MKKLFFLLSLFVLTACSSPKVSNIKYKYVENNPENYQTVTKAIIKIDTHSDLNGDIKTQEFPNSTITYYDEKGEMITYEYIDTINQAIEQNKNGMTLVANNGKGTVITYDAQIKDKIEHKTYSVPYLAEFSVKNVVTENDLKKAIKKNKPEIKYEWQGSQSNVIDEIIVRQIDEYTVNEYTYDMASGKYKFKDVKKEKVTEHKYKYNNMLELIETSTFKRDKN